MKWTDHQIAELKQMCFAEDADMRKFSNAEIAKFFDVPVSEIHAKRSQLGITIPKCKAAQGKLAITVNSEFEAAIAEAEKEMPIRKTGLCRDVRQAFKHLNDEILLAMGSNWTSPEKARAYGYLAAVLSSTEEAFDRMVQGEEAFDRMMLGEAQRHE